MPARLLALLLALLVLAAPRLATAQTDVLICAAESASWRADVKSSLDATGQLGVVDTMDCGSQTPTVAMLQIYAAVMVREDGCYADANPLGQNLADYADAGGGVVVAAGPGCSGIQGRFATSGYAPLSWGGFNKRGTHMHLVPNQPSHPILDGVNTFDGGQQTDHRVLSRRRRAA